MAQSLSLERQPLLRVPAALVTVAAMIVLPMLIHLLPSAGGAALGARLLPIFYAPLLAVLLLDGWVAVAASLAAPIINHWLTGMPAPEMVALLTAELVAFSVIAVLLSRGRTQLWWIGPVAYLLGKALVWLVFSLLPIGPAMLSLTGYANGVILALPGLLALALIGLGAQWMKARAG